jgi:5-methylcytosine-specific restriction enzyme A
MRSLRDAGAVSEQEKEHYLECHHIVWLAEGGEDTIANTVALCPNCHRKMHVLNRKVDKEQLTKRAVEKEHTAQ